MLHGIIDIGSSTVRMAIYDIHGGDIDMLLKKKHVVGLAAYVKDGVMTQQGIDKAVEILGEFVSFLHCFHITHVAAFTTAALRNAKNSREAVAEIERRTGLSIRVISGDEEATFDFIGATHAFGHESGLLVDIGGGSTELVAFAGGSIQQKVSLPLGATDFHARFDAVRREYTYFLHRSKDPFVEAFSWQCGYPGLDFDAMNQAAAALVGTHDFSCFEKVGADNKTSVCTVFEAFWQPYIPSLTAICGGAADGTFPSSAAGKGPVCVPQGDPSTGIARP